LISKSQTAVTDTQGIDEYWPSWSPLGDEIVVQWVDVDADPNVPDIVIYKADGTGTPESLVQAPNVFAGMTLNDLGEPHWANTNPDLFLFRARLNGGDNDIYCMERSSKRVVNVTQHRDTSERAELNDFYPRWLPDDSGIIFTRNSKQFIEMNLTDTTRAVRLALPTQRQKFSSR